MTELYRNNSLSGRAQLRMEPEFSLGSGGGDEVTRTRTFSADAAVVDWERDGVEYSLAPVLVCTPPEKTVGLGDSISAAGLEGHRFLVQDPHL